MTKGAFVKKRLLFKCILFSVDVFGFS